MADDYDDEGDITDLYDGEDDDAADCQQFLDGGVIVCGALGSEWCDFECPLRCDLGLTPKEAEERAIEEVCAALDAQRQAKGNAEYESWLSSATESNANSSASSTRSTQK